MAELAIARTPRLLFHPPEAGKRPELTPVLPLALNLQSLPLRPRFFPMRSGVLVWILTPDHDPPHQSNQDVEP